MIFTILADVGYGVRQLRRNPGFSAVAIATLALGIGGITAMFSVFDAVLIRRMPYAASERLVMVWDDMTGRTSPPSSLPRPRNGSSGAGSIRSSPTSPSANRSRRRCRATAARNRCPHEASRGRSGASWA
jgi:hypothetical protein